MIFSLRKTLLGSSLVFTALAMYGIDAAATPVLRCHLQQGETAGDIKVVPTADPYGVTALRINHFRFKAVMVGTTSGVDYVKLYTYVETENGAAGDVRLLHEVKYLKPQPQRETSPSSLTGTVYLYEPRLGREFSYDCALREEESSNTAP